LFIKVEPAGFFMHTVKLIFDLDKPDSEDTEVRDYLAQHELEPRYRWDDELDDNNAEVIQFGGCYLGNHLQSIGQIQRKAVEVELLVEVISPYVHELFTEKGLIQVSICKGVINELVSEFHDESYFGSNESGELSVSLPQDEILRSAKLILNKNS
jgi:hypothetical protein